MDFAATAAMATFIYLYLLKKVSQEKRVFYAQHSLLKMLQLFLNHKYLILVGIL